MGIINVTERRDRTPLPAALFDLTQRIIKQRSIHYWLGVE
jgi:hypothetical protein